MRSVILTVVLVACRARPDALASNDAIGDLLAAYDRHSVVLVGESHWLRQAGDFYVRLVRDPRFARVVDTIVIEFASRQSQPLLDRYLAGEPIAASELRTIWRDTTKVAGWESPIYAEWLAAIRDVDRQLPPARRVRVLAGDTAIDWKAIHSHETWAALGDNDRSFADVIVHDVLDRGKRALVVLGSNHVMKSGDRHGGPNTTTRVEAHAPGSSYVVLLSVPRYFHDPAIDARLRDPPMMTPLAGTTLAPYGDAMLFVGRELDEVKPRPDTIEPAYLDELDRRALIEWGEPRHRKLLGIP